MTMIVALSHFPQSLAYGEHLFHQRHRICADAGVRSNLGSMGALLDNAAIEPFVVAVQLWKIQVCAA